jgi:hypothetical protein
MIRKVQWLGYGVLVVLWVYTVRRIARDQHLDPKQRPLYTVGAILMPGLVIYYWCWLWMHGWPGHWRDEHRDWSRRA